MRLLLLLALTASTIAAEFPAPFNTETAAGGPMTPDQAAASVRTPPGFRVTMFAAEPDVQQPIAIATDSRGRLWVVECYTYAEAKVNYDTKLRDRILIFEDADNDGRFDKRTVFWDQGERLTSVELGFGGVWVAASPHLLFIPDKNGDDIPDGPPEVLLDGWDTGPIRHNIVNGLRWGPDGWLYGRHGILATSLVGAPGTPAAQRTKMNVGIWRYHPTRKAFEVVANGGTNPWGMDWNEVGEAFFTNTVTGHLWHLIPGAHYERMYGEDPNPRVYQLMGMCADHYHFDTGAGWVKSRATLDGVPASASDALGGGHAHCGCLIYQGEQWPEYWRGKVLTINFHGRRLNVERLERSGSGYVAKHEPDAFFFGDPWFRGIDLIQSADGGVFVADWSDASECHDNDGVHRTSGRIYKIKYGDGKRVAANPGRVGVPPAGAGILPGPSNAGNAGSVNNASPNSDGPRGTPGPAGATPTLPGDLATLTDTELVRLQKSRNEWLVRTSRRILQERAVVRPIEQPAINLLRTIWEEVIGNEPAVLPLRSLWTHHVTGVMAVDRSDKTISRHDEQVRAWRVWLVAEGGRGLSATANFLRNAREEMSPLVRRSYASALPHFQIDSRAALARALAGNNAPDDDRNLALLIWYGIADMADEAPDLFGTIATETRIPLLRHLAAWRAAELLDTNPKIIALLLKTRDASENGGDSRELLNGFSDGLRGRRKAPRPVGWPEFVANLKHGDEATAALVRSLSVIFGDGVALDEIRAIALDAKAEIPARRQALQSLIDARAPDLRAICEQALDVRDLAGVAARGLAIFDDPKLGTLLVQRYGGIYAHLRPDVIGALVSRPAWAALLLDAIANGQIARTDLGAYQARQIRAFNDVALTKRLAEVWGDVRETDDAKKALIAKLKMQLTSDVLAKADLPTGRALFTQTCAVCHKLYGEGGAFGPDLTGSARELTYLVENIADPSAIVPVDFRMSIVTLKDGRVLTGFVGAKTDRAFTLRGLTDTHTIERADVKEMTYSPQSLMPEGILSAMNETQVRDLIGYLMGKSQVPLPADAK